MRKVLNALSILCVGLVVGLSLDLGQANALVELCDMSSQETILACVQAKTTDIDEANLPNEYHVEKTKAAREDLLILLARFEGRTDTYAREVLQHKLAVEKATHVGVVVQYEDEPRLHYFYISAKGEFALVFDLNTIDLKSDYPAVHDLVTYALHANGLSSSLRESLEYGYQDDEGLSVACDISEEREVSKYYANLLKVDETSSGVKRIAADKMQPGVHRCTNQVDIAFELGDGYYDVQWNDWFAVYGPDKKTIEGYLARFGVTYTEANDPSQVDEVIVRFNHLGQRVSKVGEY